MEIRRFLSNRVTYNRPGCINTCDLEIGYQLYLKGSHMTQTSNSLKWILINNSKCLHFVNLEITNTQKLRPAIF